MQLLSLFTIVSSLLLPYSVRGFIPAPAGGILASSPSWAVIHTSTSTRAFNNDVSARHHRYFLTATAEASSSTAKTTTRTKKTSLRSSEGGDDEDTQAEIAALEERLRQLKEKEEVAPSSSAIAVETPAADEDDDEGMLEGETDDSIMFSERWKEAKDGYVTKQEEKSMGGIAKAAGALAFVIFLGLFSQVPVGEESLQRYQDVKGSSSRIDLGDLNPVQ